MAPSPTTPAATRSIGLILNGVTGRMGYRQHLVRSILPIRDQGGLDLPDGSKLQVRPLLVGRNAARLAELAERHGVPDYTTDLAAALADPQWEVYGDFLATKARPAALRQAIAAGKAIYTEKPTAVTLDDAVALARLAAEQGIFNGVVHDKLYLPGLRKLRRLIDGGFFGRVLAVHIEFGYWVFEGDWQPSQRPSWNYKAAEGGGMVTDMFPHWSYLIENLFGPVESVYVQTATHIPQRWDEAGAPYEATAEDAAYAVLEVAGGIIVTIDSSWATRVNREELVEFHVDGTEGSAVVGLFSGYAQHRSATPKPVWNPDEPDGHDYFADWSEIPDNEDFGNGFRRQWEDFLVAYALGRPYPYDLLSGARGVQLAEVGLESARRGEKITLTRLEAAAA
jgi:predicted dehydrogenase